MFFGPEVMICHVLSRISWITFDFHNIVMFVIKFLIFLKSIFLILFYGAQHQQLFETFGHEGVNILLYLIGDLLYLEYFNAQK